MELLSRHTSNPLEASSDNSVNKQYLEELGPIIDREKNRGSRDPSSVHDNAEPEEEEDEEDMVSHEGEEDHSIEDEEISDEENFLEPVMDEGDEEANTILLKDRHEQQQIIYEIEDLKNAVPDLADDYEIVDRLGEGTFSSVYKAVDLRHHDKWYNLNWQGHHPIGSAARFQSEPHPKNRKVYVAIKRIYTTSSPARIQNEIALMEDCTGCRNVGALITAFRVKDQVVAVMPFHHNSDFREYYSTCDLWCIQAYMGCLLRALRDIHARGIIHRDVKPANFLFDPISLNGILVDFGLAQRVLFGANSDCNHTAATRDALHGKLKSFDTEDMQRMRHNLNEGRKKAAGPSEKVGWLAEDNRKNIKANRAGTRGFRAPEVLLKCEEQTAALDIWSAGTILLCFLTRKFPIFNANDDIEALMEITCFLGRKQMEKCAQLHNRTFMTNVPAVDHPGVPWQEVVERLNPDSKHTVHPLYDLVLDLLRQMMAPDNTKRITARDALYHPFLLAQADDDGELELQPESRECFDVDTGEICTVVGDDLYVPHPIGEGVCKKGHWLDDETGEHCCFIVVDVQVKKNKHSGKRKVDEAKADRREPIERELGIITINLGSEGVTTNDRSARLRGEIKVRIKRLSAGEGIAIGMDPCEFHREIIIPGSFLPQPDPWTQEDMERESYGAENEAMGEEEDNEEDGQEEDEDEDEYM